MFPCIGTNSDNEGKDVRLIFLTESTTSSSKENKRPCVGCNEPTEYRDTDSNGKDFPLCVDCHHTGNYYPGNY